MADKKLENGFGLAILDGSQPTDIFHGNRGGIDRGIRIVIPDIANNLTETTAGKTLDAVQGPIIKTGLDFAMNAALLLFKYDAPWTVVLSTLDLIVTIPDGDIQLPNKTSYPVTGVGGTVVNGGGIKLTFNAFTNTFTYTFVSDLTTIVEGSDKNIIVIAKNIAGELLTANASLKNAIMGMGSEIHWATNKTTPVDADEVGLWDSVTGLLNKLTWANLIAPLKSYADGLVVGLLDDRGNYDASVNTFPATGGSGTAGAILKGDLWYISVDGALGGVAVNIGDSVRALSNTPGQTATNWDILESNIGYVPENSANKVTSLSGSSTDTQYPSAKLAYDQLALKAPATSPTFAASITGSFLTASEILGTDADKKIVSLPVANYPSLSELAFVKGLTSSAQNQITHAKWEKQLSCSDLTTALVAGTSKAYFRMPFAGTLTDVRASVLTAATGATLLTVDINEGGASILSTKLTFDASEKTTTTAATPAVISDATLADDAEITIDIDSVGNTIAGAGLIVTLIGTRI